MRRVRWPARAATATVSAVTVPAGPAAAGPGNHVVSVAASADWTAREVTAAILDDAENVAFGVFLAGPGQVGLRDPELSRA